ncbi:hypothetical protein HZC31_00470 [Candidatus Woesearchaeota archaeon]|nr:hypothetical protein [Candidatus Woesearchaeota archaeon]
MEFWNSLLTEKSWKILQGMKKEPYSFIVIGGWAAYLWTKQHKSKDIDIILPNIKDLDFLKQNYDLKKNDHLKKYEIQFEEIDLDIYVPYYSQLTLPVEDIKREIITIEGIPVVAAEILLILKQGAEIDRKDSIKGQKDRIDIVTLLCFAPIDFKKYIFLLKKYNLEEYRIRVKHILTGFSDIKYLSLTHQEFVKIKKELLKKL